MTVPSTVSCSRYERWSGHLRSGPSSWLAIVTTGIRLAFRLTAVRLLILGMFLSFGVFTCIVFYVLSLLEMLVGNTENSVAYSFITGLLHVDLSGVAQIADFREVLWRTIFMFIIRIQLFAVLIIVARVGPGLIADDIKSRALPIYFARPVRPITYLTGKWMVVAAFIGLVILAPNLLALTGGTLLTGGLKASEPMSGTLFLGLRLLVVGLGVMLCGGALSLMLSSLSSDKRYVAVGWLAICLVPIALQSILHDRLPAATTTGWLGSVSLSGNVLVLTEWVMDLRQAWEATPLPPEAYNHTLGRPITPMYPALVLLVVTLMSALICYRRVVRFSRAAANV